MAVLKLLAVMTSLVTLCTCHKNFTVTYTATLEFEVKNYNNQGDDINHKVVIGIFGDTAPITSLNFKQLCNGWAKEGKKVSFKNTYCHRMVKDMLLQCGDVTVGDGSGSISVYGNRFNDENFDISHRSGGIISMANHGKDTNGSQFFFILGPCRFLDKKHVAFGKVIKGYDVLMAINCMGNHDSDSQAPRRPVRIVDCSTEDVKRYELSEKDMEKDDFERNP